jgi:hypothetical protein
MQTIVRFLRFGRNELNTSPLSSTLPPSAGSLRMTSTLIVGSRHASPFVSGNAIGITQRRSCRTAAD